MTDESPKILVVDDHDNPDPYLLTGIGHYPVVCAYRDADTGTIVVVLDYQSMYRTIRSHILNPPPCGPASDPGSP